MATNSKIEWTDRTWNPVVGCTWASAGCDHCYAATMTRRLEAMGQADYTGLTSKKHFNGVVRTLERRLGEPLDWKKPSRVFVNSMSDLFHKDVPAEFIARVFAIMGLASWHTFQVLTKRPERAAEILNDVAFANAVVDASDEFSDEADDAAQRFGYVNVMRRMKGDWRNIDHTALPLGNVWLGASVEDQDAVARVDHLRRVPGAVRFLSVEPLIGPVDLPPAVLGHWTNPDGTGSWFSPVPGKVYVPLIHLVIVGGESGPGARPCNVEWIRSIVGQCKAAGVACFVKQLGADPRCEHATLNHAAIRRGLGADSSTCLKCGFVQPHDSKGGDISEFPADLRVREMPAAVEVSR